ncbi:putative polyketide synthase [Metarhizium anisopliae]|nr:putative polyketide synthase [Metarhizium anisopliae]
MSLNRNTSSPIPIAIVGSSCRLPGQSCTASKLYDLLCEPRDDKGYLLDEDSCVFDASFFGVSPYKADSIDPQLRVILEAVYESFESAGWTLDQMRWSQTSVHVAVMASDDYDIQARDPETVPMYATTGVHRCTLSNRVLYAFDLYGPSITLNTAFNLIFDAVLYIMFSNLHMLLPESQLIIWDKTANGYARGKGMVVVVLKPLKQALYDGNHLKAVI